MPFVDTNVLLYAVCPSSGDLAKARIARDILKRSDLVFSVQVFQEFYVQATRQNRVDVISHDEAKLVIGKFSRHPVVSLTPSLMQNAFTIKERYGISYWDAAILAAAIESGSSEIYTEDLNTGQSYNNVIAINPFV